MKWTPDLLKEHYDERIAALEHRLDGFPQEYLSETEGDELRKAFEAMRSDHVQRREMGEARNSIDLLRADYVPRRELDEIKTRLAESAGRRAAWGIAAGVILASLTLLYGASYKNQLTHDDVTAQVKTEAPWLSDRPSIERQLSAIELQQQRIEQQLIQIAALNRFFCKTRQPVLPAC